MDVLLTGNLSGVTQEFSKQLCVDNKLVLATEEIVKKDLYKEVISFSFAFDDPMFNKLFKTYSFSTVVYMATRGEQQNGLQSGNLENLNTVLRLCSENKVPQVIYVSSSEVYAGNEDIDSINEETVPIPLTNEGYMLESAESICRFYKQKVGLNTVVLHVPYLYGDVASDSFLTRTLRKAGQKGAITLPGAQEQHCDFVKDTDLAKLIGKIIDEGYHFPQGVINIGSDKPITFGELVQLFKEAFSDIEVAFSVDESSVPPPVPNETARKYYDWISLYDLSSQFNEIVNNIAFEAIEHKSLWSIVQEKASRYQILLQGLELVLGFFLMEYLNFVTETSVLYRFVDFRLLFVVIMGSVHGMFFGVIAALLACISCVIGYVGQGLGWQVLIYNVNNWLPFVAYLVAGMVTGYTKDKSSNALRCQTEQMVSLEEHYMFLYELYDQTLKNKSQYKDQLMGYRDSFGRIYAITKKLDSVIPDEVFQKAINVFEEILDNQTITIYTVASDSKYARLAVCSRELAEKAQNSIKLDNYSYMVDCLTKDAVWYNKDILADYPAYCAPVYDQDRLVALIMIHEAGYDQISTYYVNLIKVLSGLIQASLVRAANYNTAIEDKIYITGTHILKNEKFSEILSVKLKMKEDQLADFILLYIENSPDNLAQLSTLIDGGTRKTDVAGLGKDGSIYLILSQAKKDNLEFMLKRLKASGVLCSQIELSESMMI